MRERGIIKWQPFDSLPRDKIIPKNKIKITKPILSVDQLEKNDILLKECFYNKLKCTIKYFYNYQIYKETGTIIYLKESKLYLSADTMKAIYFNQIIEIKILS